MAWVLLVVAGLLEVGWAIGLKYTEGFTQLWPSVLTVAAMVLSVVLLGVAMKSLPVGTSYAVWPARRSEAPARALRTFRQTHRLRSALPFPARYPQWKSTRPNSSWSPGSSPQAAAASQARH
jgi:hypothetical protein